jgi:hypothetical protein
LSGVFLETDILLKRKLKRHLKMFAIGYQGDAMPLVAEC